MLVTLSSLRWLNGFVAGAISAVMPLSAMAQQSSQAGAYNQQRTSSSSSWNSAFGNGVGDPGSSSSSTSTGATVEAGAGAGRYQPDEIVESRSGNARSDRSDRSDGVDRDVGSDVRGRDRSKSNDRSRNAKPNEFELFVSTLAGHKVRRFGSELLVPEARDFTAPPTTAIPADYRINPGDELVVGLTGSVQASALRLVVDQDGRIFIPKVGAVRVGGVPYRDLQSAIASQVARQYRDFRVSVSVGELHGITVYVTGFAAVPGSYTVSSLSTVVNAVFAAGGPSEGGSFRSIQVRRSGRLVSDFDLYAFLLKGDKRGDVVLQNGDVITIAPSGAQIAAIGSVNREAIYETRGTDTLNDVLLYAGGANTVADVSRLHVLDPKGENGWQELSPGDAATRLAQRGEVLRVLSAVGIAQPSQRMQSLVTISGEVMKPGRYFVKAGSSLEDVVAMAGGLTPEAYTFGSVFVRDSLRRQQQINFEKAVNETRIALTAAPLVTAKTRDADVASRVTAVNALVDQLRDRIIDGRMVLEGSPGSRQVLGSFVVENNDELYIPPQPLAVGVYGMVNSTANFRYQRGLSVRDYLKMAGGFTRIADKGHVFVIRPNGTVISGRSAMSSKSLPGDMIFVPVDSERGLVWEKIRDLLTFTMQSTLTAAAVVSATK